MALWRRKILWNYKNTWTYDKNGKLWEIKINIVETFWNKLKIVKEMGVNRLSIGVQTVNDKINLETLEKGVYWINIKSALKNNIIKIIKL